MAGLAKIVFTPTGGSPFELQTFAGGTGVFLPKENVDQFFPVAEYEEEFAESSDTEGGRRTKSKPKNPEGVGEVVVSGGAQAEFEGYLDEWQELVETMRKFGGTMEYTPAEGTKITYVIESMVVSDAPYDGLQILGWVQTFGFKFTCLPYGLLEKRGAKLRAADRFSYDSLLNRDWLYDQGSGTLQVVSGQLFRTSTSGVKRIYRDAYEFSDAVHVAEITTGEEILSATLGLILKRKDASNYSRVVINFNGATSSLTVARTTGGGSSNLKTSSTFLLSTETTYWLRVEMTGSTVNASIYAVDPRHEAEATPIGSVSHTLSGGDATNYGINVWGTPGIYHSVYEDYSVDNWTCEGLQVRTTKPLASYEVPDVPGHVDALGDLKITERTGQSRRHLELGLEAGGESYDATVGPPSLIDSESMETASFAGKSEPSTGAYGANAIRGTVTKYPSAICGVSGKHVGRYRIKTRVKVTEGETGDVVYVRFAWRPPSSVQLSYNDYAKVPIVAESSGEWCEIDLGVIDVEVAPSGEQRWEGRVECFVGSSKSSTLIIAVDYLELIGASRWAKSTTAVSPAAPGLIQVRDEFDQAAGNLNGKLLPDGSGSWATSGEGATDFKTSGAGKLTRSGNFEEGNSREATPPKGPYSVVAASLDFEWSQVPPESGIGSLGGSMYTGLRFGETATSYMAMVHFGQGSGVAGKATYEETYFNVGGRSLYQYPFKENVTYSMTVLVVGGSFIVAWLGQNGVLPESPTLVSSTSLTNQKVKIVDYYLGYSTKITRTYDNFRVWVPDLDAVLLANQAARLRSSDGIRANAAGTTWGKLPNFTGSRLRVPAAGQRGLSSRLSLKARRNNVDEFVDENLTDQIQAELEVTPRVVLLG